jgi:hypothetical protein
MRASQMPAMAGRLNQVQQHDCRKNEAIKSPLHARNRFLVLA